MLAVIFGISLIVAAGPIYAQNPIAATIVSGFGTVLVCLMSMIGGILMIPHTAIETIVMMCDGILT
jgi:ABC-type uncharacterized transport system permease subunit